MTLREQFHDLLRELRLILVEDGSPRMSRAELMTESGRLLHRRFTLPLCVAMFATVTVMLVIDLL